MLGEEFLAYFDPEIKKVIELEEKRQLSKLELIASENFTSPAVRLTMASVLTHKYAEGYPGKRYYGGCEFVDMAEELARTRAAELFGAEYVNVQPHSGSQANMAVYFACLQPGDTIMGMDLAHGGHLTHGSPASFSGKLYKTVFYGVDRESEQLDYAQIEKLAVEHRPKIIVAGASAYPRTIDFAQFRKIAEQVGAKLMVDMAHIAGLVAAKEHPSPIPYAHFTTTTTHKTLRGPRGGMILSQTDFAKVLNSQIFPGIQGGPLMHIIAAKAVALKEALSPQFKEYQGQVVKNAKALAEALMDLGFRIVSGGTDNHLLLVDLSQQNITGKEAEEVLDKAGITVNKNTIPFETKSPFVTSGIRLGTPAVTTRGLKEAEMETIAQWISDALHKRDNEQALAGIRAEVKKFLADYPLFNW